MTAGLGWVALIVATAGVVRALVRRAAAHGILLPVVMGIALRLVVMAITHAGSVSLGDQGIFFLDDETYRLGGGVLADQWRSGHLPDPSRYNVLGTYQFGYQLFLGLIFTLGTTSVLLGKLSNVLVGSVTVYLVARLGGQLLGERAKLRAAWIAALAPGMVWWSATLMKEALATMLLVLGLLAVTALPRRRALVTLALVLLVLMVVRGPAAVALVVGAGVAVAIAGRKAEGRLLSRPLIVFATTLVAGFAAAVLVVSHGDLANFYTQYDQVVRRMFSLYGGGSPAHVSYNAVKSLVTPLPCCRGAFDSHTRNWDRMLYLDVWLLFCALPLAAIGAWRLRRRPEALAALATVITALLINSVIGGLTFRQRSMLEPLILLFALGGVTSWRMAARWSAAALGIVVAIAAVHSRSLLALAAVAAAAGGLFLLSRRLSSHPFEPPPDSPMEASFCASFGSSAPAG